MADASWVALGGAIVGAIAGVGALARTFMERPKYRADAMTLVNSAAISTMDRIDKDAASVRDRLIGLEAKLNQAERKIDILEDREDRFRKVLLRVVADNRELRTTLGELGLDVPECSVTATEITALVRESVRESA